jgi:hypothetical protein
MSEITELHITADIHMYVQNSWSTLFHTGVHLHYKLLEVSNKQHRFVTMCTMELTYSVIPVTDRLLDADGYTFSGFLRKNDNLVFVLSLSFKHYSIIVYETSASS